MCHCPKFVCIFPTYQNGLAFCPKFVYNNRTVATMRGDPPDLKTQITERIQATPDAVWTPVDFLDLGSREVVDKTLPWLREALADPDDRRRILRRRRTILADKDQGPAIAADLAKGLPTLPSWMQDFVRALVADDADDGRRLARHAASGRAVPS